MKVLHLSDYSLPHRRIEKSAITGLNNGYRVFFAGKSPSNGYNDSKIFEKSYTLIWPTTNYNKELLIPYIVLGKTSIWNAVKKQIKKILEEIRPDIVHAHNLLAAKLVSEFDVQMIYNDHEYWSNFVKRKYEPKLISNNNIFSNKIKNFLYNRIINIWSKWESDIVSNYPTLVVSKTILNEMKKKYLKEKFLLPNFPLKTETPMLNTPEIRDLNSVYAGVESLKEASIYRNITGLDQVFNKNDIGKLILIGRTNFQPTDKVIYKGLLSRNDMYEEMAKYSVGLVPWKRHWSHKYFNPNKAFEYAHSGLHVICTSSLSDIVETLDNNCTTIEDYNDLVTKLLYFRDNKEELYKKRVKVLSFAKENLIWEKYEKNIIEAYKSI